MSKRKSKRPYVPPTIFFDGLSHREVHLLGIMFAISPHTTSRPRYQKILSEFTGKEFDPSEDAPPKFTARQEDIAAMWRYSRATTQRTIYELRDKEKIKIVKKPGRGGYCTYYLNWP